MTNPQIKQQLESLQNDVNHLKKVNARNDAITDYVKNRYGNRSPAQHAAELLRQLKDRYTNNTGVWKRLIRDMGSAYEKALTEFNKIKKIQKMEARAREQIVFNILSVFAGAGMCWIGPALRTSTVFGKTFTSEGAKTFFSGGFQEVIKQSAIRFTKNYPDIVFKTDLTGKDRDAALSHPMQFQNDRLNAFDRCAEMVQGQLSDMIEEFSISQDYSAGPLANLMRSYAYDIDDFTLSDQQIIQKIDGLYGKINQFIKEMNEHCINTAFYFREKPAFDIDSSSDFKDAMAVRFERAMWAAWIPHNLKQIEREQIPVARHLQPGKQPWLPQYYSSQNLRNLQPGYYYIPGSPDYVMRVYEDYEKPGRTLEKRLEYLKVIKSEDCKRPPALGDRLRQLENFGMVTFKSEIKKLIAWAQTELKNPYRHQEFQVKTRDRAELYIKALA